MIPTAEEVLVGYRFAARRWGLSKPPNAVAVAAAVEDARRLSSGDPVSETAAVFFAFARRPRAFPGAWRLMPALLALNQARARAWRLDTDRTELSSLLTSIATRELDFDAVRDWFEARMAPK